MLIAGVDEVGRGPLAGPVVAAAVILNPEHTIVGLADSKQLSPKKREQLFIEIQQHCLAWSIGRAEAFEIDEINILQATLLAMQRAVARLKNFEPNLVLIDGNRCPTLNYPSQAIVNGDQTVPAISAASILAKVMRDREMLIYDVYYPEYGFGQHKGYGTKQHLTAIREHGLSPLHRKSFCHVEP